MSTTRGSRRPATEQARRRVLEGVPLSERRVEVAGIDTAVLEGGEGPPLVLLHGAGEFAATWARVIPDLLRTHRLLVPDLPGHGASGVPDSKLDVDTMVAWLDELIALTCPSPPAVAGHLLGGALAARFARTRGSQLDNLILVDSYGLAPLRPTPGFALAMVGFIARPSERTQRGLMRQCMDDVDQVRAAAEGYLEVLEAYMLECARTPTMKAALRQLMPALGTAVIPEEDLAGIAVPTTMIWGRNDRQVRLRVAEAASARFGWPLHVIDDCADDPAFEQPDACRDALHAALAVTRKGTRS
ncbi:MAG TPA: alpha/beta fold hydrolase [Egibacteraceae bacterium]|nr:alpha/beta fold hydrolase [Egibacteraceae bacterium]